MPAGFISGICPALRYGSVPREQPWRSCFQIDGVVFDYGVGEELFAHVRKRSLGLGWVALGYIEFDIFSLADIFDSEKAKRAQRGLNSFALRGEHSVF